MRECAAQRIVPSRVTLASQGSLLEMQEFTWYSRPAESELELNELSRFFFSR